MKPKLLALLLLVVVGVGFIVYSIYPDRPRGPSDKAQVESLAEQLITAVLQSDEEVLNEILDADFVFDRSDMLMTRSQFIRDISAGDLWVRLSDEREVEAAGDAAFIITPFDANIVIGDEFLEVSGTMTLDFVKQEKTWSVRSIRIMPLF
ncbi:MAG: nuclear transport factor 2 family protein [Firmicutes bacterium]|nr:nuclear transport factor 2 family protein [Bacillota bacterium]